MSGKSWEELWWISYVVLGVWIVNGFLVIYMQFQIDTIVNVQLYSYGLQFSKQWADSYWMSSRLTMVFLGVPMALSTAVFVAWFRRFRKKAKIIMAKRKIKHQKDTLEEKQSDALEELTQATQKEPEEKTQVSLEEKHANPPQVDSDTELEEKLEQKPINEPQAIIIQPDVIQLEKADHDTELVEAEEEEQGVNTTLGLVVCPSCGKIINRPLITLDFSNGTTHLVKVCPFCNYVLGDALDSCNKENV
jgi:hypothetical protein